MKNEEFWLLRGWLDRASPVVGAGETPTIPVRVGSVRISSVGASTVGYRRSYAGETPTIPAKTNPGESEIIK